MLKKIGKLSLIIIVFVALTACNSNSNGGSGNTDSDKYNFAFLPNTQNNSFQTAMTQRFEELSKEEDFDFTDRKSTRLNSSNVSISFASFCLKIKILLNT